MTTELDETRPPVPLREQRRAELRQRLSDTATAMFLKNGFHAVKVADIARACGVTEKTVFNHFRSKESLLVDRWDAMIASVRTNLDNRSTPVLDGTVATLSVELDFLTQSGNASPEHMAAVSRFGALIASTPALQDHRSRSQHQLTAAILAALAERLETHPDDPDTQITAEALAGLFTVFYRSLGRHAPSQDAGSCRRNVQVDIHQAADQLANGISD